MYAKIAHEGLWKNNPGLVQLLGLCPLLAVSNNLINGLTLGLATMLVLLTSNVLVSLVRKQLQAEFRIPIFVMIIAASVTTIELLMNAFWHELHLILGIFIPIITTNCVILGRAEAFASKNAVHHAAWDGLMMGTGFGAALVCLGAMRELLAQGTLFDQAHLLFGDWGKALTITLVDDFDGMLLAVLPPGAFIGLGLLIALKNWIDQRMQPKPALQAAPQARAEAA